MSLLLYTCRLYSALMLTLNNYLQRAFLGYSVFYPITLFRVSTVRVNVPTLPYFYNMYGILRLG